MMNCPVCGKEASQSSYLLLRQMFCLCAPEMLGEHVEMADKKTGEKGMG